LKYVVIIFFLFFTANLASADSADSAKVKFYNFNDLLINGEYKKPQILYTDSRQKVKFEKLLKLQQDFMIKLKNTAKDPSLK